MTQRLRIRARSKANALSVMGFKAALVKQRKDHHLSQATVAERMGVTQPTVADFERYDSNPTLRTIQKYANAVDSLISFRVDDDCGEKETASAFREITLNFQSTRPTWRNPQQSASEAHSPGKYQRYPVAVTP